MTPSPDPLKIPIEECGDHAILRPSGYLNAEAGNRIDKVCRQLLDRDVRYIIVNFNGVSMVNTIAISILVGIIEKVLGRNGMVYFTELGETNRQVFEVLNLTTVAMIFRSDAEAREHLGLDQEAVRRATRK